MTKRVTKNEELIKRIEMQTLNMKEAEEEEEEEKEEEEKVQLESPEETTNEQRITKTEDEIKKIKDYLKESADSNKITIKTCEPFIH